MDLVTIDFETFYDSEYSLSKMTTEKYIRDERFEVIGLTAKLNKAPAVWCGGGDDVAAFLAGLRLEDKAVLCHNTAFDGAILSWRFGIKPRFWFDTMSMARPAHSVTVGGSLKALAAYYQLGEKGSEVVNARGKRRADFTVDELARYAAYCLNDTELTYKLFQKLRREFPVSELMVINQTIGMYTKPVIELDREVLDSHLKEVVEGKDRLLQTLHEQFSGTRTSPDGIKSILMSNSKMAEYLQLLGVDPPQKISPRTGALTWAFGKTDKGLLALLEHEDERVSTLVAARLGVKSTIEQSRTERLIGVHGRGLLPVMLVYYAAHTGRFGGGDKMNLQNLPRGGALRRSLKARKGKRLVACDSSQIEARVVALLGRQMDLVTAFREKRDVYSEFATEVYGVKVTKADKVYRFVGKTSILGLGYGLGHVKLQRTLELGQGGVSVKVDLDEAQRIVFLYRAKNHGIVAFWKRCQHALTKMANGESGQLNDLLRFEGDTIFLPNGMKLRYHGLRADGTGGFVYINDARQYREFVRRRVLGMPFEDLGWTRIYGGKVCENITQALARIIVTEQMVAIGQRYEVALQVHDEIVIECDEDEAEEAKAFMEAIMSTPPKWMPDLPVACEAGIGENYGEAK